MRVAEIFHSFLGESTLAGTRAAFVRLAGCNLRCTWCDTQYAWDGGEDMTPRAVIEALRAFGAPVVLVTGGEPLLQSDTPLLLSLLDDSGFIVQLETNGSMDVSNVPPIVMKVLDVKCPGSAHSDANRFENLDHLTPRDNVKFVIADRTDYEWARGTLDAFKIDKRCTVLFSPVHGGIEADELASWMLSDRVPARLQMQLHKCVWGSSKRGV
jgi:7-carboxy-7-deazaguanine synthase